MRKLMLLGIARRHNDRRELSNRMTLERLGRDACRSRP
jgi:hypothetical protein